jgi:hypothetical protein
MDMFIILIMMVSGVYTYIQTYQTVCIKNMWFVV